MADAYMQYEHEASGVIARWHGGAYIDLGYIATENVGPRNNHGDWSHEAGEFVAWDCINVWDYAKDEPTIDRTLAALAECVDNHIDGEDDE